MKREARAFANPYLAGVGLGVVLLLSFLIAGKGLGASGAAYRVGLSGLSTVAPDHAAGSAYMAQSLGGGTPLHNHYVFLLIGVGLGALVSAYLAGRLGAEVIRGPRIGVRARLGLAVLGGVIMGFAARMALGCTSGQALSGGALLSAGSWIFMLSVFAGGYAVALVVRRQWT